MAALPNSVVYSDSDQVVVEALVRARDIALGSCGYSLDFLDSRHGFFKKHLPLRAGGSVPARGLTYSQSTRLTRLITLRVQ